MEETHLRMRGEAVQVWASDRKGVTSPPPPPQDLLVYLSSVTCFSHRERADAKHV